MPQWFACSRIERDKIVVRIACKHKIPGSAEEPTFVARGLPCVAPLDLASAIVQGFQHCLRPVAVLLSALAGSVSFAADKETKDKPYPLDKCVVSGEKLGELGKPYVFKHEGHEVQLCCKDCLKDFKKDPAKYMKKLDEAEAKAKK